MVAARKNESKMTEAKQGRSEAAAVEKLEDDSELAVLTKEVALFMTILDNKNSTSSNQRNKRDTVQLRNWKKIVRWLF